MTPAGANRLRLVSVAVLFSTGGVAIKATSLGAWQVASFRAGVAVLTLLIALPAARRGWSWRIVPVALAYAATTVLFVLANKLTTSANAIFLQSTSPLYLAVLAPLLLHERVRRQDVAVIAVVAAGLLLILSGSGAPQATAPAPERGNVLALLSGVAWACTMVGLRWVGTRGEDAAVPTVVLGNLFAFAGGLPFALQGGAPTATDAWMVLYLGVVQIGIAYALLSRALRDVPALQASLLLLLEPALNPTWSWLVHGEAPGATAVAGGVVIASATLASAAWDARGARVRGAAAAG